MSEAFWHDIGKDVKPDDLVFPKKEEKVLLRYYKNKTSELAHGVGMFTGNDWIAENGQSIYQSGGSVTHWGYIPVVSKERMPFRTLGYRQEVMVHNMPILFSTSEYVSGRVGYINCTIGNEGTYTRAMTNAFCRAVTLGLQYGIPVEVFVNEYIFSRFPPNGSVKGHAHIKKCDSVLDFMFRDIAVNYLNRVDLKHV